MPVTPSNRKAHSDKRTAISTRSIDPESNLLSPPNHKAPTSTSAVHPFFTPRRNPLRKVTSSGSNSRGRGLPSPEASPSHRQSKRSRISKSLFGENEQPIFITPLIEDAETRGGTGLEPGPPPPLPKKIKSTFSNRVLMRSLGGYGVSWRDPGQRGFSCAGMGLLIRHRSMLMWR